MIEIYSFGYKNKVFKHFSDALKEKGIRCLIDTRFNPHCFSPFWKKKTLESCTPIYDIDYYHIQELGNTRYFEDGEINIKDLNCGIDRIKDIADDWDCDKICLLCTCENFNTCHNKIIVEELVKDKNFKYKGRI